MTFPLSHIPYSYPEYVDSVQALLGNKRTIVFLDTNILSYCYRLHSAARSELFKWFSGLIKEGRLWLPSWALSEYTSKFAANQLQEYSAKNKNAEDIQRTLDGLLSDARGFIDDASAKSLGLADRDEYLLRFGEAAKGLALLLKGFRRDLDIARVHDELLGALGGAVYYSDLGRLLEKARIEAPARYSSSYPPGFADDSKKSNAFGDLVLWYQVLDFGSKFKGKFERLALISNDQKRDWVYRPRTRTLSAAAPTKVVPNRDPEIAFADPRLSDELRSVAPNTDFDVLPLFSVVEALAKGDASSFPHIAKAVQIDYKASREGGRPAVESISEAPNASLDRPQTEREPDSYDGEGSSTEPKALSVDEEAIRDSLYEADGRLKIDKIIVDLQSHNWYTQNPAIQRIKELRGQQYSTEAWFVLGRNIYQAAVGGANDAVEFLENVDYHLGKLGSHAGNAVLAGMLFEIFFNAKGQFRGDRLKVGNIGPIFALAERAEYGLARRFIRDKLRQYQDNVVLMPGENESVALRIIVQKPKSATQKAVLLKSVILGRARELLAPSKESRGAKHYTVEEIMHGVMATYAVPETKLSIVVEPGELANAVFETPDDRMLLV